MHVPRKYGPTVALAILFAWMDAQPPALFGDGPAAHNWPTRLKDVRRGGVTPEQLSLHLEQAWVYTTSRAPVPAWVESPARDDDYHDYYDLKPRQNFDKCFDVAVVGDLVYFGSSNTGAVTCLNAAQGGREVWTFFTDGPVRFAPHVVRDRVYFGSDDGFVYCLNAADGSVVWRERAGPSGDKIWGNQRMISVWPVRSSVLVDGPDVFWTAGLFPAEGMFLCKRNAADGSGGWTVTPTKPHQGYLLATQQFLVAPSGKSSPVVYHRRDGARLGDLQKSRRDGGSWALVTPDEDIWSGPTVDGQAQRFTKGGKTFVASMAAANLLVVAGPFAYYCDDSSIVKKGLKDYSVEWKAAHAGCGALIIAGNYLFVGGATQVMTLDAATGGRLWAAPVDGNIYGLAVAAKRLYASTDKGSVYCFENPATGEGTPQRRGLSQ